MRIVIDMQGAQAESSKRGIGRLTLSLSRTITRQNESHEIILVLNSAFPESIDEIKTAFADIIPQKNIRMWSPLDFKPFIHATSDADFERIKISELIRESFIASLNPSMVVITSLFEGLADKAVTSIGNLIQRKKYVTAVITYDFIPWIYQDRYLANPVAKKWYEEKLSFFKKADLLLCISESTRKEAVKYSGLKGSSIFTIYAGIEPFFKTHDVQDSIKENIYKRYQLTKPLLMYTGGIDYRKNVEGLIHAFSKLPVALKKNHQLIIVCAISPGDQNRLRRLCKSYHLSENDVIFTGYVSDNDLLHLYNLCKLFIFPSWHEGFGLPILEAIACGKAVIGSNLTSIPELIGLEAATFDPFNVDSIASKIEEVLVDDAFRNHLEQHALEQIQKFSWEKSAQLAIQYLEKFAANFYENKTINSEHTKTSLAYVSPLPPEHTGIADYSAELIPALNQYYDIDVIVYQKEITDPFILKHCGIKNIEWFETHFSQYDRILYHFGNSTYHQHMFHLLEKAPGVVVLHDFFLSGIIAHMEIHGNLKDFWLKELYHSHGYRALQQFFDPEKNGSLVWDYPCNKSVTDNALGIIVHSKYSQKLAEKWLNKTTAETWQIIPLLRSSTKTTNKKQARETLNLNQDQFIVCSFGILGSTKLNMRLIKAWAQSRLNGNHDCSLIFVGEIGDDIYNQKIKELIRSNNLERQVIITGWVDAPTFKYFLEVADLAVQLRANSRGETSAAVMDCMNHGMSVIVNAHGAMSDLPSETVYMLNDDFTDAELTLALEDLWRDKTKRTELGINAREFILHDHNIEACAKQYAVAIENYYVQYNRNDLMALCYQTASWAIKMENNVDVINIAQKISETHYNGTQKQLFLDISELVRRGSKSGIQRVVRNLLKELINNPPIGYRVEPVYADTTHEGYRYANKFTLELLHCNVPNFLSKDPPIDAGTGDAFFGLDLAPDVTGYQVNYLRSLKHKGVMIKFLVYDLLPMQLPQFFVPGVDDFFENWLHAIIKFDGIVCDSKTTSRAFDTWIQTNNIKLPSHFTNAWFHLGADFKKTDLTLNMPSGSDLILKKISNTTSFLMVGTIEPCKGHAQILAAFEKLWETDKEINLVFVGKQGWMVKNLIKQISSHPEKNKKFFWLQDINDLYLKKIYTASTCLIAASYNEGFGLPLIEAAQYGIPIIARDLPVFREVAGEHAFYFDAASSKEVHSAIIEWLQLYNAGKHPQSKGMPYLTWEESAEQLKKVLFTT